MTFDFRDLEAHLGHPGRDTLATRIGVPASRLDRLRATPLDLEAADALATAAGLHPTEVWTDWPGDDDELREWLAL